MNIASIDIGTNTILLMIAEISTEFPPKIIKDQIQMPRLGEGLAKTGFISQSKINEAQLVLDEYFKTIKENHCNTILVNATHALRTAGNGGEIVNYFQNRYNCRFNVLTGLEEAALAYKGAVNPSLIQNNMVIDIGGGSTEIIIGDNKNVTHKASFKAGVVTLKELMQNDSKFSIEKYLKDIIILDSTLMSGISTAIGIAGTPVAVYCMLNGIKYFKSDLIEGGTFDKNELKNLQTKLQKLTPEEILSTYGPIIKGRQDLILNGIRILMFLMEISGLTKILVSTNGLRLGAILEYLDSTKD